MQWYETLWTQFAQAGLVLSWIIASAIGLASILFVRKILLSLIVLTFAPIPIRTNIRAQGELGKSWYAAGAIAILDSITIAFAAAHGVAPIVQVHAFKTKLIHRPISWPKKRGPKGDPRKNETLLQTFERLHGKFDRWFDPQPTKRFLLRQRRFVRVDRLDGSLVYSLSDFAWTGMSLGALYTFAGLLTPLGSFQIEPQWEEQTKAQLRIEFDISAWPIRILGSALAFTIIHIKLRRPRNKRLAPAQASNREAQHGR